MSEAYYLETNGYTERVNQTFERYLCTFYNFEQNKGRKMFLIMESAIDKIGTLAIAISSFYTSYDYNLRIN
jgi:hypothetical protein